MGALDLDDEIKKFKEKYHNFKKKKESDNLSDRDINIMQLSIEKDLEELEAFSEKVQKETGNYEKEILALSVGLFGFTITFAGNFISIAEPDFIIRIKLAWAFIAMSIFGLLSGKFIQLYFKTRHINSAVQGVLKGAGIFSFFCGIFFFLAFMWAAV